MDCDEICPFSNKFKAKCHNLLKIDKDYSKLQIYKYLGSGYFSQTYLVDMDGIKVLKYIDLNNTFNEAHERRMDSVQKENFIDSSLNREICNQNTASKFEIAPRVYTYWKCNIQKKAIIIMEYILGKTLKEYFDRNIDQFPLYLKIIRKILELNLRAKISQNDLYFDNIILSGDKIYLIDFGKSDEYDGQCNDLVMFTINYMVEYYNDDYFRWVKKHNLDFPEGWKKIMKLFDSIDNIIEYLQSDRPVFST